LVDTEYFSYFLLQTPSFLKKNYICSDLADHVGQKSLRQSIKNRFTIKIWRYSASSLQNDGKECFLVLRRKDESFNGSLQIRMAGGGMAENNTRPGIDVYWKLSAVLIHARQRLTIQK